MKLKYPKFTLFFLFVIAAIFLYEDAQQPELHALIISVGYLGAFISGVMYTYGFTTPFATALLLVFGGELNIFLAAFIAGFGSVISDLFIFTFIRKSFSDEIKLVSHEKVIERIEKHVAKRFRKPLVYFIAAIITAAPVPDELAVSLLATYSEISPKAFMIFSYISNTLGMLVLLYIGSLI